MATITVEVVGSSIGAVRVTEELDGVNGDMVLAYIAATFGRDQHGNRRLPAEMVAAYWAPIRQRLLEDALRYHQEQAAQKAREAVAPIVSTTKVGE